MSQSEFDSLPRSPGWAFAFRNGFAHVSPSRSRTSFILHLSTLKEEQSGSSFRAPTGQTRLSLTELFVTCFLPSIDFASYPEPAVRSAATDFFDRFFSPANVPFASHSKIVHSHDDSILAASLISGSPSGRPLLDAVFTSPNARRAGLATALTLASAAALGASGYSHLESVCFDGNLPSEAWHRHLGFIPSPRRSQ